MLYIDDVLVGNDKYTQAKGLLIYNKYTQTESLLIHPF